MYHDRILVLVTYRAIVVRSIVVDAVEVGGPAAIVPESAMIDLRTVGPEVVGILVFG